MPTTKNTADEIQEFELSELTELMIKARGIHEGLYRVGINFSVTIGSIDEEERVFPGVIAKVKKAGLFKADEMGPNVIDAAKVNPAKKPRKTKVSE